MCKDTHQVPSLSAGYIFLCVFWLMFSVCRRLIYLCWLHSKWIQCDFVNRIDSNKQRNTHKKSKQTNGWNENKVEKRKNNNFVRRKITHINFRIVWTGKSFG